MAWTKLPTDYQDAVWNGNRKYKMITNSDGTVSFEDVTEYSQKENSFFGADEANAMNAGMNELAENMESVAENAQTAKTAAETATAKATAAANSASAASSSQSSAASSASTASSKATAAASSATSAANSASAAATSAEEAAASADVAATLLYSGAGAHNAIYRGKYLGSAVTDEQYAAISAGTFEDLYIGDYWTINGVNWRIAAFDYYLNCGDTNTTKHHAVIVPDTCLYNAQMNTSNVTTGGYVGSAKVQKVIDQAEKYPEWHKQSLDIQKQFSDAITAIKEDQAKSSQQLERLATLISENEATACRYRILRFNDEILHEQKHTKEHFDQILDDITRYEKYCEEHPEYENNKAVLAIENVERIYKKCSDENLFL